MPSTEVSFRGSGRRGRGASGGRADPVPAGRRPDLQRPFATPDERRNSQQGAERIASRSGGAIRWSVRRAAAAPGSSRGRAGCPPWVARAREPVRRCRARQRVLRVGAVRDGERGSERSTPWLASRLGVRPEAEHPSARAPSYLAPNVSRPAVRRRQAEAVGAGIPDEGLDVDRLSQEGGQGGHLDRCRGRAAAQGHRNADIGADQQLAPPSCPATRASRAD